jgi:hypothetical protein
MEMSEAIKEKIINKWNFFKNIKWNFFKINKWNFFKNIKNIKNNLVLRKIFIKYQGYILEE